MQGAQAVQPIIDKFVQYILNPALMVLFSFGLLIFVFGLVEFLYNLSKGADTRAGRDHMLWGLAGMFIMVSVFGIIRLLSDTFNFGVPSPGQTYQPNMSTMNSFTGSSFIK
ncbi:hypothetical protein C4568_02055 [Candidatus Parcubacteria bacterium]|nr:MAG: hypothetical protein C4568_02055 [Candidatus Parcubacteria bacterium]